MGLVAAGTMASATPAAAGYACGPWNGWCSWYGNYGWKKHYGWGGYGGNRYWNKPYWGSPYGYGGGKKAYRKGKNKHYGYRNYNRRHYY
jgi:hypothetical protein